MRVIYKCLINDGTWIVTGGRGVIDIVEEIEEVEET